MWIRSNIEYRSVIIGSRRICSRWVVKKKKKRKTITKGESRSGSMEGWREGGPIRATISSGSAQLAETYFRLDTGQTLFGLNRRCDLGVLSCLVVEDDQRYRSNGVPTGIVDPTFGTRCAKRPE